jgi:ribonuclease HII
MPSLVLARSLYKKVVIGIDEAGRGPLAGPVVAAAVVLGEDFHHESINDSKQLSKLQRKELSEYIKKVAVSFSIVAVGARRIDKINILQATRLAMKFASERVQGALVLVDGISKIDTPHEQITAIKADETFYEVAAASILAKQYRDSLMTKLSHQFPEYGFERHSGYPTKLHKTAIKNHGLCYVHRKTFKGVC